MKRQMCTLTAGKVYLPENEWLRVVLGGFRGILSRHSGAKRLLYSPGGYFTVTRKKFKPHTFNL